MSNKYKKVLGGMVKEAKQGWLERGLNIAGTGLLGLGYPAGKIIKDRVQTHGANVLDRWGQHVNKNVVPKLVQGAADEVKKQLPAMSQDAGNNFMSGALNNKQLHSWLSRGGGAIAGALLLSAFIKNKPLAILLGGLGGGYLGDYIHKNWKGDWGKTWSGMKKEWGWK